MPQHDYILDNQPGAAFRADLNNALAAIAQLNSGPVAPSTTYPYMWWMEAPLDGGEGVLHQRNAGNSDWVVRTFPDLTNNGVAIGEGATVGSSLDSVVIGKGAGSATGFMGENVAIGKGAFSSGSSANGNIAIGLSALSSGTTSSSNVAIGRNVMLSGTIASQNVAIGDSALLTSVEGMGNTAIGYHALEGSGSGSGAMSSNVAIGSYALSDNTTGSRNVVVGASAMTVSTTGYDNVAIGHQSLDANTTGYKNVAIGYDCMTANTSGHQNVAIGGVEVMYSNVAGAINVAIGSYAMRANTYGSQNVAIGSDALRSNTAYSYNVAIGYGALYNTTSGGDNTAVGKQALLASVSYNNTTGIGAGANVTGSSQVQLGNSSTTTYVYGTVQNRSDLRDKADVRDTTLGLDFINALRPVDYRWDLRDSYRAPLPDIQETATDDERAAIMAAHLEANTLANITRDGSKKRTRYHHGLIAQEVAAVIQSTGMDFGGYQDHSIQGGEDVLSIGYDELIAPLIKAVQELSARVVELEARLSE